MLSHVRRWVDPRGRGEAAKINLGWAHELLIGTGAPRVELEMGARSDTVSA